MAETLCVVVPVFNEEEGISAFAGALSSVLETLNLDWRVLFVDDGSSDQTMTAARALHLFDPRFTVLGLSRNFGKETAIAAGLQHARGDAVVLMDGDHEHPPQVLPQFVALWRQGYRVVLGQRRETSGDSLMRRLGSKLFHQLFRLASKQKLAEGAVDFVLLDRIAADAMNKLGESNRFTKGLYAWIGFKSATVPFEVGSRIAGKSKWRLGQLVRFAFDGLFAFSSAPLRVCSYAGFLISLLAIGYSGLFVIQTLLHGADVAGFPSLIVSIMVFAGLQLISLGILGEYVARIYAEVKGRPLYLVEEAVGLNVAPVRQVFSRPPLYAVEPPLKAQA